MSGASKAVEAATSSGDVHGKPEPGMTCLATWDDITEEDYCEYQTHPSMKWQPSKYSEATLQHLLDTQFKNYIENVQKSDCVKELTRLLTAGPPIWLFDTDALPVPEGDTHICNVWFMNGDRTVSAKLKGAVEGDEHAELWESLRAFLVTAKSSSNEK